LDRFDWQLHTSGNAPGEHLPIASGFSGEHDMACGGPDTARTVAGGQSVVPERGVQYPRGLATGDTVTVEYDLSDPEQVRVAGRSVLDGVVPTLLGVAAVWAVLGPLALWLRRRRVGRAGPGRGVAAPSQACPGDRGRSGARRGSAGGVMERVPSRS